MKELKQILQPETKRFYYHEGEKRYLNIDPDKVLLILKTTDSSRDLNRLVTQIDPSNEVVNLDSTFANVNMDDPGPYLILHLQKNKVTSGNIPELRFTDVIDDIYSVSPLFIDDSIDSLFGLNRTVIGKLKKGVNIEDVAFIFEHNISVADPVNALPGTYIFNIDDDSEFDALDIANYLFETGKFEYAQPNFFRSLPHLSVTPNDPTYPSQWHLPKIQAPDAWCWNTGALCHIGIMDVAIQYSHSDLSVNYGGTFDLTGHSAGYDSHGTTCAGAAAAVGNNGIGVASVGFQAKFYSLRIGYNPTSNWDYPYFYSEDYWIGMCFLKAGAPLPDGFALDVVSCSFARGGGE